MRLRSALLIAALFLASPASAAPKALFDNAHAETAGNADWVIDNDQPVPVPAQSGIGPNTAGTFWTGAISSWGVDLVKRGYTVHTNTAALTYGSGTNPYDLSNYDVLIVDEPNTLFSAAEASAIFAFVQNGGGLVAVSDHSGSDRNNDGADSPVIWNALDPNHLLFGVHCGVAADANNNIVQTSTNVNPSATDSVTRGPIGNVTGLAFHNGTTFTLFPAANPTVRGEVWMNGLSQSSTTGVMAASARYGSGRVFIVGDSSPCDDGSANSGNTSIFDGWGEAGATDSTLFLNATLWATRRAAPAGDTQAPTVTVTSPNGGETWKVGSTHAITWTATDNVGVTAVSIAYSTNGGATYPNSIATGLANSGSFSWMVPADLSNAVRVRVTAVDAAANPGVDAGDANSTIDAWTLTASAGAGGTVTPSGTLAVVEGATLGYTIASNPGFRIADVNVDGVAVGAVPAWTFAAVDSNHVLVASFADSTTPAVLVLSPNGGESYTIGDTLHVTWNASDADGAPVVDVLLSRTGAGGPWESLATGIANDGSHAWVVDGPPTTDAWIRVVAHDAAGNTGADLSNAAFDIADVLGVLDGPVREFALDPVRPNPARGPVTLGFASPRPTRARLSIVDLQGREVAVLFEGEFAAGRRSATWNPTAAGVPTGLYWARLTSPAGTRVRRIAILR